MSLKKNKEITKDQAVFMTVNDWKFTFELWPNKYKFDTMNHLFMPEFILNIDWKPLVYFIDIFYILWKRILELKALKLYLASYKDMKFNSFKEVLKKLKSDLVVLAEPKYLKINIINRQHTITFSDVIGEKGDNFAFDSYLNSISEEKVKKEHKKECFISSYFDAIVNIGHSIPIICDVYAISNKDIKEPFLKATMSLKDQKLITEEVPKFILEKLKKYSDDIEVIVDYNIRGNIKKIRSVFQGDLNKLIKREEYIQQILSQFNSYTN